MIIISTTLGKNPLEQMGSHHSQQKSLRCSTWVQSQKQQNDLSVRFQGKPFNITVIQVYIPISNGEEAEVERFYEDLQVLLELCPKKMYFSLSDLLHSVLTDTRSIHISTNDMVFFLFMAE